MNKKVVHLDNTSIVQLDSINIKAWAENRVKIPSVETRTKGCKIQGSKELGTNKLIKIDSVLNEEEKMKSKMHAVKMPKTGIAVNKPYNLVNKNTVYEESNPRELQEKIDQQDQFEIFEKGSNLYAKIHHSNKPENNTIETKKIIIKTDKFEPRNKRSKTFPEMRLDSAKISIGLSGINLGHCNVQGKGALECILVAHGYYFITPPSAWNKTIIDDIVKVGTQLFYRQSILQKQKGDLTRCFQINNYQMEVALCQTEYIGKIMSDKESVMDLKQGLARFFEYEQFGAFKSPGLIIWIMKKEIFYIFDPRGRTTNCSRDENGGASLILLANLENVYHLIRSLSNVNEKSSFKIYTLEINQFIEFPKTQKNHQSQTINCKYFQKLLRKAEFQVINDYNAILFGDLHYSHEDLGNTNNKQSLLTSIMSVIYSKIDPPNSWSANEMNKVHILGNRFYLGCSEDDLISIEDLPLNITIGDKYIQFEIVPTLFKEEFQSTNLYFDNKICKGLRTVFADSTINAVLVQLDKYFYSIWRNDQICYLFDGYSKNKFGNLTTEGASCLLMTSNLEQMCEAFVNRSMKLFYSSKTVTIHALLIKSLEKLIMEKNRVFKSVEKEDVVSLMESIEILMPVRSTKLKKSDDFDLSYNFLMEAEQNESWVVVQDFLLDLIRLVIPDPPKVQLQSEDKRIKIKSMKPVIQVQPALIAEKVLLKSDLQSLKQLKHDITVEKLPVKVCDERLKKKISMSLSQELLLPSYFVQMPDGSQIVRGTKNIDQFKVQEIVTLKKSSLFWNSIGSGEYVSKSILHIVKDIQREIVQKAMSSPDHSKVVNSSRVLTAISFILVSYKYKIPNWTPQTLDKVLDITQQLGEVLDFPNEDIFCSMTDFHLPTVELDSKIYRTVLVAQESFNFENLQTNITKYFKYFTSLLLVSSSGSLAVYYQNNYYLYESVPCNEVGFRMKEPGDGVSCLLRFKSLKLLVKRIQANHPDILDKQKVFVFQLILKKVKDKNLKVEYKYCSKAVEENILKRLKINKMSADKEKKSLLRSVDRELRKERNRIRNFEGGSYFEDSASDLESSGNEDGEITTEESLLIVDSNISAIHQNQFIFNPPCGYQMDKTWKFPVIQGTFGLKHSEAKNSVSACHFTSIYAIMHLVHHPISSFCYRTVDMILEKGIALHDALNVKIFKEQLQIRNVLIDNINYELLVQLHCSFENEDELKEGLLKYFSEQNYLIIRIIDICFAIYQDKNKKLHLFDSYGKIEQRAHWIMLNNIDELMQHLNVISISELRLSSIYTVAISGYKKAHAAPANHYCFIQSYEKFNDDHNIPDETVENVLCSDQGVVWSRLEKYNLSKTPRCLPQAKWKDYNIEVENLVFSLWGNIHPNLIVFGKNAGKQHLAIGIVSLLMSHLYKVDEWTAELLDSIVVYGHKYFEECIAAISGKNQEFSVETLKQHFEMNSFKFELQISPKVFGVLYDSDTSSFNLRKALQYFFLHKKYKYGILQCNRRFLAIGCDNRKYFMFDCQAAGWPLFAKNQGTVYVLRCCSMWSLQLCIVQTLREKCHNVEFFLFSVKIQLINNVSKSQKPSQITQKSEESINQSTSVKENSSIYESPYETENPETITEEAP